MNKLLTHEVRHKYAGNGYAIATLIGDEYCKLVPIGRNEIGEQAFLAWLPLCSVETRIDTDPKTKAKSTVEVELNETVMGLVADLREKIDSGKVAIVRTHFVPVK